MSIFQDNFLDLVNICPTDPNSLKCLRSRNFFLDLLESQYLARFFRIPPRFIPPIPLPQGTAGLGDPHPQPSFAALQDIQNGLTGELLLYALRPTSNSNVPSLIDELKKSGLQLQVVNGLIHKFEQATVALKKEAEALKKEANQNC